MDKSDHQCRQCIRSSIVIDALCDRIKTLEGRVARASSEAPYKSTKEIFTGVTSLDQSFSSNSTLVEPTAKDHTYVLSAVTRNDPPLIDLLDNAADTYHDAFSGDKAAFSRTHITSTTIDLSCSVHSFSYIQHFAKPPIQSKLLSEVRDNAIKKQSKLLTGLEHSIWAPKQAEQRLVHEDVSLKRESVSNENDSVKRPLSARNCSTDSVEKSEAPIGKSNNHLNHEQRFGSLSRYPMGYIPSSGDREVYRTVSISGLKRSFTMSQILSQVRGGIVVDAKLMNTSKLLGSTSALVTFLNQSSAMGFENHAKKYSLTGAGFKVTVNLLTTPTWPLAKGFEMAIRGQGLSRCLRLQNCPKSVSATDLQKHLEGCWTTNLSNIEDIIFDRDGHVEIRFSSITAAQQAFGIFTSLRYVNATHGRKIEYATDPCAQPFGQM